LAAIGIKVNFVAIVRSRDLLCYPYLPVDQANTKSDEEYYKQVRKFTYAGANVHIYIPGLKLP